MNTKSKTPIEKFEDFFREVYREEIFEILERYPDESDLVIDYNKLEMFDPDLADLLIDKPEGVISLAERAIKNLGPLVKNADISVKFEEVSNVIPFKELTSTYVGQL